VKKQGRVYLVGAGPGRADLITVRGAEVLRTADCVIYDRLVNEALLELARGDAEIIQTPKGVGSEVFTQEEINNLLIEKASAGKTVVRLKGGDPFIFGRAGEEVTAIAEAGIDFELVPGVTAGIAAAEYSGIMPTDRNYSSQVLFVTGREADGKQESNIDWATLAGFKGTIIFYMAVGNLGFIAEQLIKNGMDKQTPTAVVADATLPNQSIIKRPLRLIAQQCRKAKVSPPAIVIIGAAADSHAGWSWFMNQPLFGKNIVVTRDCRGNADFANRIVRCGANPIEFATVQIKPLTQMNRFLRTLAKIAEFDWIVFTSTNGVRIFFEALKTLAKDARVFGSAKIAAIGSETAAGLAEFGIRADFLPTVYTSEELGKQLVNSANLEGKKVLLLRSQLAGSELDELLEKAGAEVENEAVYTVMPEKSECKWLIEKITEGSIDWLTFASSSSVTGFFDRVPVDVVNSSKVKVAAIGPVTAEKLTSLAVRVDVTAKPHTIEGLLAAIKRMEE